MPMNITWTFAPGQIIFASRFNTNFTDVKTWADNHELTASAVHGVVGTIVGTTDTQNLSNKTILDNVVWKSGTAFNGILDHTNTAERTYTYPDASGNVPSLPTPATTETGTGAIVRAESPTINNLTATGTFVFPSGAAGTVPIGTIIPFYDYNGALTFDAAIWGYCNGQILNFTGIGPQTTPDLSGRYLIGFGTVGGADINTDPWATAAVGNSGWTINIQHSHTANAHTHDMGNHTHDLANHTHTGPSHTHTLSDSAYAFIAMPAQGGSSTTEISYRTLTVADWTAEDRCDSVQDQSLSATRTAGVPLGGATDADGTGNTGAPSTNTSGTPSTNTTSTASATGTDNQLSTTQEIRPSSIRVRYLIRYT